MTAWPGTEVELPSGRRLYVRHAESAHAGPPMVFVHGLGGSSANWTILMNDLRRDYDVWAPDLPGFGLAPPADDHSIAAYVRDIAAFLERFDEPVHVVGNSMGGLISTLLAASRPDLVATLSLLAPAMPQYRVPAAAWATAALAVPWLGQWLMARMSQIPEEEQVARLASVMYARPDAIDPDLFEFSVEQRRNWAGQPHATGVMLSAARSTVARYLPLRRRRVWGTARRILCPTLVVISGKDALVGSRGAGNWRRVLPRARIVYLPTSGHVPMIEHPDIVISLVRTFVSDVSGRAGVPGRGRNVQQTDSIAGNERERGTVGHR